MAGRADDKNWLAFEEGDLYAPSFAAAALDRMEAHRKRLETSLLCRRMQASWREYYSRGEHGNCDDTQLNAGGDNGELVNLRPATYRRLIQDRIALVQQTPPDFEPMALNSDADSQAQCQLAVGILDHYKREAHLEELGIARFEMSSVLSSSYFHIRWEPQSGRIVAAEDVPAKGGKPATQRPVYEGDLTFRIGSEFDTAYDPSSPDPARPRWWIVREPVNRWDLLAHFGGDSPEIEQAIRGAEPFSKFTADFGFEPGAYEYDDSIAVYWVYGEKSASVENGRKALVLDAKTVLIDGPLDEDRAGVFPLWPSRVMFRPEGHTNNFGGLPVAKAYGAQITTILSNHANFGLQRLVTPRKGNVTNMQINAGLGMVDYDHVDATGNPIPPPSTLKTLDSPPELFTLLSVLDALQDKTQGGAGVLRGEDSATKGDSGSKAALLLSQAQQIGSGDVRAKMRSDEEVATFIISSVRRHAKVERVIAIAGKANSYAARQFKGEDLSQIARVSVRQANPARDTFAGRMGMAELLKDLPPEQREQMQALVLTGRIEPMTQDIEQHRLMIDRENEALRDPAEQAPETLKTDKHLEHIKRHLPVLDGADMRDPANQAARARVEKHIADHVARLMPGHPLFAGTELLMVTGQQALPNPAAQNGPPDGMPPNKPDDQGGGEQPTKKSGGSPMAQGNAGDGPRMPAMPKNPATGQPASAGPNAVGPGAGQPITAGPT